MLTIDLDTFTFNHDIDLKFLTFAPLCLLASCGGDSTIDTSVVQVTTPTVAPAAAPIS